MMPVSRKDLRNRQQQNFENKIYKDPQSGCWLWIGCVGPDGYGRCKLGTRTISPARMSWVLYKEDLLGTERVSTTCNNKLCCNPEHLYDKAATFTAIHKYYLALEQANSSKR